MVAGHAGISLLISVHMYIISLSEVKQLVSVLLN